MKHIQKVLALLLVLSLLAGMVPAVFAAEPDATIAANAEKDLRYLALDDENNGPHDLYYQQKIMNPVTEDSFVLWYSGKNTGYPIAWASSDPALIRINDTTHMAELVRVPDEDAQVTLTATMSVPYTSGSSESYPMTKELTVRVPGPATKLQMDYDALTITNPDDVRENLPLLRKGKYGADIAWTSSDPAVISDESPDSALYDGGVVTRPDYGQASVPVTLTATLTGAGKTLTKTFEVRVSPKPAPAAERDHYLFVCYAENYDWNGDRLTTEEIYFGLSDDGMQWQNINVYTLNGREYTRPILRSTVGDMGTRDPHIVRSPDGDKFYVLATDLHAVGNPLPEREGAEFKRSSFDCVNGNRDLVIWETNDLTDWGEPRLVKCNFASAGNTYAPEAVWDESKQAYLVYWASKDNAELNPDGSYKPNKVGKIYYCYTRDFNTFSEPTLWLASTDEAMKKAFPNVSGEYDVYDTSIRYDPYDGLYYRFGTKNRLYVQTSESLDGPWSDAIAIPGAMNNSNIEAPTTYQLPDGSWMLLGDNYRQYVPYQAEHLADFVAGNYQAKSFQYASNGPRYKHGTILPITEQEYLSLLTAYDDTLPVQDAPAEGEGFAIDYRAETITIAEGYEVRADSTTGAPVASGSVAPWMGRTMYVRRPAAEGVRASEWTATTVSTPPAAPALAPRICRSADGLEVLNAAEFADCEFSVGGDWNTDGVFRNLLPGTDYDLRIRFAATDRSFASGAATYTASTCSAGGAGNLLPGDSLRIDGTMVERSGDAVTAQRGETTASIAVDDGAEVSITADGILRLPTQTEIRVGELSFQGSMFDLSAMTVIHQVDFLYENGAPKDTVYVAHGGLIPRPEDPVWEGYYFGGWYDAEPYLFPWDFDAQRVEYDMPLYARWAPLPQFDDTPKDAYYYDAVFWAAVHEPQITTGTSSAKFSPDATCTRAQVVTFLWRAMGCPLSTLADSPFTDVKPGDYYHDAVLWAVERGITKGTSDTAFSPDAGCTRAQVVTFLWRAMRQPQPASQDNPFSDVAAGQYYSDAVLWAVEKEITKGTSADKFSPDSTCTRGQIVTFLWRALAE